MFSLSKQVDYALQFLMELTTLPDGEWLSLRVFADERTISFLFLQKIVRKLKQKGYVSSTKGVHGGYRLAIDAGTLSLKHIIEAVEGPYASAACMKGEHCPIEEKCTSKQVFSVVQQDIILSLEKHTLNDMMKMSV